MFNRRKAKKSAPRLEPTEEGKSLRWAAIDVETATKTEGRICEIGVAVFDGNGLYLPEESFESLVKPPKNYYNGDLVEIHGITSNMTKDSPSWQEVAPQVAEVSAGLKLVAHYAVFEEKQFSAAAAQWGTWQPQDSQLYCSLRASRVLHPKPEKHTLEDVAKRMRVNYSDDRKHRALYDAQACGEVWVALFAGKGKTPIQGFAHMDELPSTAGSWEEHSGHLPPTQKQLEYLEYLLDEYDEARYGDIPQKFLKADRLTRAEVSALIDKFPPTDRQLSYLENLLDEYKDKYGAIPQKLRRTDCLTRSEVSTFIDEVKESSLSGVAIAMDKPAPTVRPWQKGTGQRPATEEQMDHLEDLIFGYEDEYGDIPQKFQKTDRLTQAQATDLIAELEKKVLY